MERDGEGERMDGGRRGERCRREGIGEGMWKIERGERREGDGGKGRSTGVDMLREMGEGGDS